MIRQAVAIRHAPLAKAQSLYLVCTPVRMKNGEPARGRQTDRQTKETRKVMNLPPTSFCARANLGLQRGDACCAYHEMLSGPLYSFVFSRSAQTDWNSPTGSSIQQEQLCHM